MNESPNVKKFLNCSKRCTAECPHIDDPAIKNICDVGKSILTHGKPIDIIPNADYERAGNICEKCDAFSPESNQAK
jgi:hypothetical protein